LALAALMVGGGVTHFVAPAAYERIVPRWAGDGRRVVLVSGAAELACGTLLLSRRTGKIGGWLTAALLVAVFPANVQMALAPAPSTKPSPTCRWAVSGRSRWPGCRSSFRLSGGLFGSPEAAEIWKKPWPRGICTHMIRTYVGVWRGMRRGGAEAAAAGPLAAAVEALLELDLDTLDDGELAEAVVQLHRQQSRLAAATTRLTAALEAPSQVIEHSFAW
jgi:uncharacterized membrane protein